MTLKIKKLYINLKKPNIFLIYNQTIEYIITKYKNHHIIIKSNFFQKYQDLVIFSTKNLCNYK